MTEEQTALHCYLSTFVLLGRYAAALWPEHGDRFQQTLVRLRSRIAFGPTPGDLRQSLCDLERDADTFVAAAAEALRAREDAYGDLLDLVMNSADDFELRDHFYLEQLNSAKKRVEADLQRQGSDHLRATLARHIAELATFVEAMRRDGTAVYEVFRQQLKQIPQRLEQSGADRGTDLLTGLAARPVLERQMAERIEAGKRFCLLLFGIAGLGNINDLFGTRSGDSVLRQAADRLVNRVRPRDVVSRWGVGEFAVVFECPLEIARHRAAEISHWVSGRYTCLARSREWKVDVEVSPGVVVEHKHGEALIVFLQRADAAACGCPAASS